MDIRNGTRPNFLIIILAAMYLYSIHETQTIPLSLADAWAFFSDPYNLEKITPPDLHLVVENNVPHIIHPGMMITYRIRPFAGIASSWVTEITHVIEDRLFVDEQRFGPYRFWHHQHFFRETPGGTEIEDLVHYALPGGPLGQLVHALAVRRRLADIFAFRRAALARLF
ncbi:MAG: SRPBCC family protein [Calditrichota bacterium]